jgi:hypothetical protein
MNWKDITIRRFVPKLFTKIISGEIVRGSIDRIDMWCNTELHFSDSFNKYVKLQDNNYVLNNVIGKIAKSLSNAHFSDAGSDNSQLLDKINNPNPKQSKEEFLKEFAIFLAAAGWTVIWKRYISIGNFKTMELINLDPDCTEIVNGKVKFDFEGEYWSIDRKDAIVFYDTRKNNGDDRGYSRAKPLRSQITNIQDVQIAKNIQIVNSGITLVSPKANLQNGNMDQGMDTPITTPIAMGNTVVRTQKDDMEEKLNVRTIGNRIIVSSKGIDATNLSAALSDIDFNDKIESDVLAIYDAYGVPIELSPYGKNSTFDNKEVAETSLIENEILPLAESLTKSLNAEFPTMGKLIVDFNHISSVAQKKNKIHDTNKVIVDTYNSLVASGVITVVEANRILTDKGIL